MTAQPRILVAGIGNIFLGDDAFGSEVARRLIERRSLPVEARVVDFGIRGFDLTYALLDGYDVTVFVDATPRGAEPGTLYTIEPDLRELDETDAQAALVEPHGMNPRAMAVMEEAGAPINDQRSKHVDELKGIPFDYVVTVCGHAHETCPAFPGNAKVVHVGFDDPPKLAKDAASDDEAMPHYRRVRDEIRSFVERFEDVVRPGNPG